MKQTLFILFSLIALRGIAAPLNSGGNQIVYTPGVYGTIADLTPTFALNSVTSTVLSSAIDLSSTGSIVVCITGTAATSPLVQVSYANLTYATFVNGPFNLGSGCWPIQATGRYVKFKSVGTSLTAATSLSYYVVSAPPTAVTIGSTITVAGTVSVNGNVTLSAGTSIVGAVGVTSTTYPVWDHATSLTQTVTGPFSVNLTHAAGTSGVLRYRISSITAATAAVLWAENESSTFPVCAAEYATGSTPVQVSNVNPGTHIHFSPTAATAISATPKVDIWVLKQTYAPVQ